MISKLLVGSNFILLAITGTLLLSGAAPSGHQSFDTLEVRRINVVDADGETKVAIAGTGRLPGAVINGVTIPAANLPGREASSGMIFFNNAGDEVGGILYAGEEIDGTGRQLGHLSMDGWRDNMVVALQHNDNGRKKYAGLRVLDQPSDGSFQKELELNMAYSNAEDQDAKAAILQELRSLERGAERMFVGSREDVAMLELKDRDGNARMRLSIGENGDGRIDFLDVDGQIIRSIDPVSGDSQP